MAELQVKELTLDQAKDIYRKHLKNDFPKDEIKPFLVIRNTWIKGNYCAYGFYERTMEGQDSLCAYAFLMADKEKRMLLLDYFAVCSPLRGSGYGSGALALLHRECVGWGGILIEVEDDELPDLDEATRYTRRRRISFYRHAGCCMTTIRSRLWGVDYRIMVLPLQDDMACENAANKLQSVYRCMYDANILKKHFAITAE